MSIKRRQRINTGIELESIDQTSSPLNREGEISVDKDTKEIVAFLDEEVRTVVTENQTQELTNKSINVDDNTITNIEVDNLKVGVLNTSVTLDSATDNQLPSALATKTYIESTTDEVQQNLQDHIDNPTNAHIASAIGFEPVGEILSEDVQGAVEEVETHAQEALTNISDHINNPTDAHDATSISVVPIAGVDSTNTQTVLEDLKEQIDAAAGLSVWGSITGTLSNQTDLQNALDSKASQSAFDILNNTVDSIASTYVDETSAQLVQNKDLIFPAIINPRRTDVKSDTYNNLVIYALTATEGQLVYAYDIDKYFGIANNLLIEIGGGGAGSLDTIVQYFGDERISDWIVSGGVTLTKEETTPMAGEASYKLTLGATTGSVTSPSTALGSGQKGQLVAVTGLFTYNGTKGDIKVQLLDQSDVVLGEVDIEQVTTNANTFKFITNILPTTTEIKIRIINLIVNNGKVLEFDNLVVTMDILDKTVVNNVTDHELAVFSTMTWAGLGTMTNNALRVARDGQFLRIFGNITVGTTSATIAQMPLPNNFGPLKIDTSGSTSYSVGSQVGTYVRGGVTQYHGGFLFSLAAYNPKLYFGTAHTFGSTSLSPMVATNGSDLFVTGELFTLDLSIPIQGWSAATPNVITPLDQVSSDNMNFVFKSTAIVDSDPIGTFNTYTYTANSNTYSISTTAPTQTSSSMQNNGILLTGRPYYTSSGPATPSRFAIKIGTAASRNILAFFGVGKTIPISLFSTFGNSNEIGLYQNYDPISGILTLDVGNCYFTTLALLRGLGSRNDTNTGVVSGYITFNASKSPAIASLPIAQRYVVKTYAVGTDWYEVYNDGWVRQGGYRTTTGALTFLVPMLNTSYNVITSIVSANTGNISLRWSEIGISAKSVTGITMWADASLANKDWVSEGYGNSTAVRNLGATPSY